MKSLVFFPGTNFSHIRGIGMEDFFKFRLVTQGLVGQIEVRRAAKIIIEIIEKQEFQGGGIMLTGSNGTGKTTITMALSSAISAQMLFVNANCAEIFSPTLSKIEILTQLCRKAIGISFFEENIMISGQVVGLDFYPKPSNRFQTIGGKIIIKNKNYQSVYQVGSKILEKLIIEKVQPGDFILLNRTNGELKKKKKSFNQQKPDLTKLEPQSWFSEIENYVVTEHLVSFQELDVLNYSGDLTSNFFLKARAEIPLKIREKIDKTVLDWISKGRVKLTRGLLVLDDIHIFDLDCLSFLGKNFEYILSPFFIFTFNGKNQKKISPNSCFFHGMPLDFLDRLLLLHMTPNTEKEIKEILKIKTGKKINFFKDKALELLTKIALEFGIHYSFYIINISFCFECNSVNHLTSFLVKKVFFLFIDFRRFIRLSSNLKAFFFGFI